MILHWEKAPRYITEFNGCRQTAQIQPGLEIGLFRERYGTDRWRILPRPEGGCWQMGMGFRTKTEALAKAEKHYGKEAP